MTSATSRILRIGARCAAIEAATEGLTAKQADAALELIADGGIVSTAHEGVYRASSSKGDTAYLVHAESGNCSCSWGLRRVSAEAKVCYHASAARLLARPVIRRVLRRSQFTQAS